MRVLIYGGRDFDLDDKGQAYLDGLWNLYDAYGKGWSVVISGTARGADQLGERWAAKMGLEVERYPADWEQYGKAAGHIRNQQMLDSGVDIAVEFPGGRGTADMRSRLEKAKVPVIKYEEE